MVTKRSYELFIIELRTLWLFETGRGYFVDSENTEAANSTFSV